MKFAYPPKKLGSDGVSSAIDNKGLGWVGGADRDTMAHKVFMKTGSLKITSARAPRNLRGHDVKVLLADEIDGYEITSEGDATLLAEKRTLAHVDRKICMGSTPTISGCSAIEARYEQSDKRIFEVPCPHCGERFEPLWNHLKWEDTSPEDVYMVCPANGCIIEESHKAAMVEAGEWRATAPDVKGHAGFRLNALVSLFENCCWSNLVQDYLTAKKRGPSKMQVFENTVLGIVSQRSIDNIDAIGLRAKCGSICRRMSSCSRVALTRSMIVSKLLFWVSR